MTVRSKERTSAVMERYSVENDDSAVTASGNFVSVTGKGTVSSKVRNYAADPFFLKKAAEAKAEIDRVGLPKKKSKKNTAH